MEGAGSPEGAKMPVRERREEMRAEAAADSGAERWWRVSTRPREAGTELAEQAMSVGREGQG